MAIYIIIYLLLLICTSLDFLRVEDRYRKIVLFVLFIILLLFRGLRWETGTDWQQFLVCFENANWNNIFTYSRYDELEELMEPGYMFLNVLIGIVGNYTFFLFVTNAFILGTWFFLSCKLTKRPIMTVAFILVSNLIFPVRLQLAAAIICLVFYFSLKKDYLLAVFICLIAYTIHKSALFVFPFIFIINKEISKYIVWSLVVLAMLGEVLANHISMLILLISVYLPENLQGNVAGYSDAVISGYTEKSFLSIVMSFMLSFFLVFIFLKARDLMNYYVKKTNLRVHKRNLRIFNVYFNCYLFMTFFFKFFSSPMLTNFTRVSEYFTLGCAICYVISYDYLKKYISEGILYSFFCVYYLYKFYGLMNTPYPEAMFPYKTIFNIW